MKTEFAYHTKNELDAYVGKDVQFLCFCSTPNHGLLEKEVTEHNVRYWLPFCGKVDATTIKIRLV